MKHFNLDDHPEYYIHEVTLYDGDTYYPDFSVARIFRFSYSGAVTVANPLNVKDGIAIRLELLATASGASVTLDTAYASYNISSPVGDVEVIEGRYIADENIFLRTTPGIVWDDMQVSLGAVRQGVSAATWTPYRGSEVLAFAKNASNKIFFTIQYSHKVKVGSDTELHIHTVVPDDLAGGVRWQLTVSYSRVMQSFGAEATNAVTQVIEVNSANRHLPMTIKNPFAEDVGISTVALCSLSRLGNDGADTYDNDVYLVAIDSHYQIDSMGSRQPYAK